jgi:hypothetical protein
MAEKKTPELQRKGREGNRWVNQRPDGKEVADWFKENVPLHDDLEPDHYVQGVTLIQQTEKTKDVIGVQDGKPVIGEVENLIWVPYAKVETRVKYFHDLMALHDDWFGVIEPVEVEGGKSKGFPPGFFTMTITPTKNGLKEEQGRFVCCSMRVRVYKADKVYEKELVNRRTGETTLVRHGELVLDGAPGTKMVPLLNRYGEPDQNAIMKAETGAVGRALGLAGMLVIPGTGVATAEDMQEAQAGAVPIEPAASPEQQTLPADEAPPPRETLVKEAQAGIARLRSDYPEDYALFIEWADGRGISGNPADLEDIKLRGLHTKVRRAIEEAEAKAADQQELEPEAEGEPQPEPAT